MLLKYKKSLLFYILIFLLWLCEWVQGTCNKDQYKCLNGVCISRSRWCNGYYDCSDNSDERYCSSSYNCPQSYKRCADGIRCIPTVWTCDGITDCKDGSDEKGCVYVNPVEGIAGVKTAREKAINWLLSQRNKNASNSKWGFNVPRVAIALYFMDEKFFLSGDKNEEEIAYELEIQLLADLLRDQKTKLTSSELAVYVNALLVTCIDPKNFHGMNLVAMLRERFDQPTNFTNPFVLLTLCNARDVITQSDVDKLTDADQDSNRPSWTDMKALTLMTLICISKLKPDNVKVDSGILKDLIIEIKDKQNRNGTFENLYMTGLAIQALIASGTGKDDLWSLPDAVKYIVSSQLSNGSFGNMLNTYYVLPVLNYKSLVNISTNHCKISSKEDEVSIITELSNKFGPKIYVKYSLWIGDEVDAARSLQLHVPANCTLFNVMEIAAEADPLYKFEFSVLNRKPYIYMTSKIQDDPESNKYWFLYKTNNGRHKMNKLTPLALSPVDIIPKNKEEYILWYRSKDWSKSHS